MKSPVEMNSLLSKLFCYITWFVILLLLLIRRDSGQLAMEACTSNSVASMKQWLLMVSKLQAQT